MAYTPPSVGPAGLFVPAYADTIADLVAKYQTNYGLNTYLAEDAADYQMMSAFTDKVADCMLAAVLAYNNNSPSSAVGAGLDRIIKNNGMVRKTASQSIATVLLTGVPNTPLNNCSVEDQSGFLWDLPALTTIGSGGTVSVQAICRTAGAVTAAAGQINQRATPTAGWVSVTNPADAVVGQPREPDSQVKARQAISVALPSQTRLDGTIAAIAQTSGVTRYNVLENPTGSTDSYGNPAHSVSAVVEGGLDAAVAQAIYANRGIGPYTNGTTVVNVTGKNGNVMPIRFTRPTYEPVFVSLSVHPLTGYTSDTTAAIEAALVTYLNSLQIGELVVLSELYGATLTVRPNPDTPMFSIRALTLGLAATPTGTTDLAMLYYEVASGVLANIVLTQV
jgi:uncharacterized phage protein gp47/JayE